MICPICKKDFNRKRYAYNSVGFIYVPVIERLEKPGGETLLFSLGSFSEEMARSNFNRSNKKNIYKDKLKRIAWIKCIEVSAI